MAYVPVGSIARGRALASGGQVSCAACHGTDLKGFGDVPSIAGHSPYNTFRQLFLFKEGSRNGAMAGVMKPYVASYSEKDMIDISAYLATLNP